MLAVEEERCLPGHDWTTEVSTEVPNLKRRPVACKWIARVQAFIVVVKEAAAVKLIGAGLGKYISASGWLIVFGRERILIDAHLANRAFWRHGPLRKPIDVNLGVARSNGWAS